MMNDKLWENLYWTSESTRPDRFAKILNTIIRKESGDNEDFIYDRQAVTDAIKIDSGIITILLKLTHYIVIIPESILHGLILTELI
jgi:hypothetical protein